MNEGAKIKIFLFVMQTQKLTKVGMKSNYLDISQFMESRAENSKSVIENKESQTFKDQIPSVRYHEFNTPVARRKRGTEDRRLQIIQEKLYDNIKLQDSLSPINFSISNQLKEK